MKPFESGDRVAFFGDSLTHAGSYHRFIRNYYFTRYPGIDLKTFNCGNGGDSARGALFRMDFDLFNFQPNKVYVLFGMNDVDRYCYGTDHPDPQNLANREAALKIYAESMETLVRRLQDAEIKEIVLISPTPYEEEAVMEEVNLKGTFRALHRCMEINERLAERYGCSTVDLLNPMLELNRRMRETDPSASLAGPDRVHPTTLGHAVMAYWILRAQNVPKNVFSVTLGLAPTMENCAVSGLQMDGENLQFHLLPFSMPYPPFPEEEAVNRLVPFRKELCAMPLAVRGLADGVYELAVDGAFCCKASAGELAEGVDLALSSPKSEKIGELNLRYQQQEMKLREIMKVEVALRERKIALEDREAIQSYMAAFLEEVKDKPWYSYYRNLFGSYFALKAEVPEIVTSMRIISEELVADPKPIDRLITLRRCPE